MGISPTRDLETLLDQTSKRWLPLSGIALRMHTPFWEEAFASYYGEPPSGDTDARWDPLFKAGFPILRQQEA